MTGNSKSKKALPLPHDRSRHGKAKNPTKADLASVDAVDLTELEHQHAIELSKGIPREIDIEELAENCTKAFGARKKAKRAFKSQTYDCLVLAYKLFLRIVGDPDECEQVAHALGLKNLKTSGKQLNAVIKKTVCQDIKYASKLGVVLRHALANRVKPKGLKAFVKELGGINGTANAYRGQSRPEKHLSHSTHGVTSKEVNSKKDSEVLPVLGDTIPRLSPDQLILSIPDDKDRLRIATARKKAKDKERAQILKRVALRVDPSGLIALRFARKRGED